MSWRSGVCLCLCVCAHWASGWVPEVTKGKVWPLPKYIAQKQSYVHINPSKINFKVTGETCDIVQEAIKRYKEVVQNILPRQKRQNCHCQDDPLEDIEVKLTSPCEVWPHLQMDEHYRMYVSCAEDDRSAQITSDSVWGLLRGLESFSQLVTPSPMNCCLMINETVMDDGPRFPHRGLLIDTSRHYLPVPLILNIISALEMNKMNVLHWHIVDDQSFPFQSQTFPALSEKGAFATDLIYTSKDVKTILEFSRLRGIRVLPEFDSPGHTQSWGKALEGFLSPCYTNHTVNGLYGPVDPSRSDNFKILEALLTEVKDVFPDKFIHIGGDEVDTMCWESNPAIKKFMEEQHIKTYWQLESYYVNKTLDIVNRLKKQAIVWQEVFVHRDHLYPDSVVHVWTGDRPGLLKEVTSKGRFALNSADWYLDFINRQWQDFYGVDITDFNGTKHEVSLVLGGEACMWGEMVDQSNIVPRIWPRASAIAERLWSHIKNDEEINSRMYDAAPRLNEHVCRMKRRGVAAQPANGPGFCPY